MSHRRLLVTLATLVAVFALALAAPFSPAAHAAPPHLPPRVHPNGGGWSSPPHCVSSTAWFVVSNPQPADRPNYRPNYRRIGGPNDGPAVSSQFNGVAATSASDVWAVGYSTDQTTGNDITLIEHYAGSSWSIVTSPNVAGTPADVLSSVAALAPNDAWAVGVVYGASQQTLVEQYNGTAWSIVASPSPGVASALNSVAADGPNDVWAVGYTDDSSGTQSPLAEHWDGKAWSVVTPTAVGTFSQFNGVSVVAGQVFAAGSSLDNSNTSHTLVERFVPGSGWSVMSTPDGGTNGSQLNASAALSTTNVWVAGMTVNADGTISTLTENWNGAVWTIVDSGPPPSAQPTSVVLTGLSAIPATTRVWNVGQNNTNSSPSTVPISEQWQGTQWQDTTTATPANTIAWFNAVAAVSTMDAWAVGTSTDQTTGITQSLIEHYAGPPAEMFCQ